MVVLVVPLVVGILVGFVFRGWRRVDLSRVVFGVIVVLIFSLGFSIGSNGELLGSLPTVGVSGLVFALFSIGFSVLFLVLVRRRLRL
jgi:hypothetical protein